MIEGRGEHDPSQRPGEVPKRKRSTRRSTGAGKQSEATRVLVPIWEVDAIRSLCGGAIYPARVEPADTVLSGRGFVSGWTGSVPADVLSSAVGQEFGASVLLEVEVPSATTKGERTNPVTVPLPLSISRIKRVLLRSEEERSILLARLRSFPDVPLELVPFEAAPAAFASPVVGELSLGDVGQYVVMGPEGGIGVRAVDKQLGVVAGLVHSMRSTGWDMPTVLKLEAALSAPLSADVGSLLGIISKCLEPDAMDSLGPAFAVALGTRLAKLGSKEGFEPESLLHDVVAELMSSIKPSEGVVLKRFAATATGVLDGTSPAGRSLMSDDGSIGLRAGLAVLRVVGDAGQLEALAKKQGGMGRRVHSLAWALVGSQRGCAALPTAVKATPGAMLLSLGDLAEAFTEGRSDSFRFELKRTRSGRRSWDLQLCGRSVATMKLLGQEELEPVLLLAERKDWEAVEGNGDLSYPLLRVGKQTTIVDFSTDPQAPVVPRERRVRVSARATEKPSKSFPSAKVWEGFVSRANSTHCALRANKGPRGWMVEYALFIDPSRPLDESVNAALDTLADAVGVAATEDTPSAEPSVTASATDTSVDVVGE